MAIAIASGVPPEKGLITAIIGGFLVSALGGSRFQIGGPAGAFIVLVAATVESHGVEGLILATMIAGVFMLAIGYLRIGVYIKYIPYPVTVGFTTGIAVIILASQIREFFGLKLSVPEPAGLVEKLPVLAGAIDTLNPIAVGIGLLTIGIIYGQKRWRPSWPGMLVAVSATSLIVTVLGLPVETIETRFGSIPQGFAWPALPDFSLDRIYTVLPNAVAFALLGSIESLLSAVVADGMTGRRHRSNCELVGQGVANIGSALFGGICVTGTIARTATNVRAGAYGPVSGMLHAFYLLVFLYVAAPLMGYVPLAALAGVLVVVAWNMIERGAFAILMRSSKGDALVLLTTLTLVVFRDLTEGIIVGFALGTALFIHRMGQSVAIETDMLIADDDVADTTDGGRTNYDLKLGSDPEFIVYRASGVFFFGAASTVETVLDRIADQHRNFILDCTAVPFLDSTGANIIAGAVRKAHHSGIRVFVTGAAPAVKRMLVTHGIAPPLAEYRESSEMVTQELRSTEGAE